MRPKLKAFQVIFTVILAHKIRRYWFILIQVFFGPTYRIKCCQSLESLLSTIFSEHALLSLQRAPGHVSSQNKVGGTGSHDCDLRQYIFFYRNLMSGLSQSVEKIKLNIFQK